MKGGTINIANVGGDGIDADEYGSIIMKGGNININLSGQDSDGIYFNVSLTNCCHSFGLIVPKDAWSECGKN